MSNQIRNPLTIETLRARRDEIRALAAQYGVTDVRIVGSVARGEATAESDVDLLIHTPENTSVFDLVGLWLDLRDMLGCEVSLIPDTADNEAFARSVRKDAVPL